MFEPSQQQPASTSFTSNPVHVSPDQNYVADIHTRLDKLENQLHNIFGAVTRISMSASASQLSGQHNLEDLVDTQTLERIRE
eukprot:6413963-Karenia_brevis.AAC.1